MAMAKARGPVLVLEIVLQSFLPVPKAMLGILVAVCLPSNPSPGLPRAISSFQAVHFPDKLLPFRLCSPSNDPPGPPRVTLPRATSSFRSVLQSFLPVPKATLGILVAVCLPSNPSPGLPRTISSFQAVFAVQ